MFWVVAIVGFSTIFTSTILAQKHIHWLLENIDVNISHDFNLLIWDTHTLAYIVITACILINIYYIYICICLTGSQVIPGSQLLTDGQNMFLLVPDHVELPPDSTIQIDNNGTDSRPVSIAATSSSANQNTATAIAPPSLCSATPLSQSQQHIIASEQNDKISIEQTMWWKYGLWHGCPLLLGCMFYR